MIAPISTTGHLVRRRQRAKLELTLVALNLAAYALATYGIAAAI